MSDILHPARAASTLGRVARRLYDTDTRTIWERDTATLPRSLRAMRARYRDFARRELAPQALANDRDPGGFAAEALFAAAARQGFQTEYMPWPWGTMRVTASARSLVLPAVLKAEEFCAADAGAGLFLLAHDLGMAPLFISAARGAYFGWLSRIYAEIRAGSPAIGAFAITEPGAGSDVESTEGAAAARLSCHFEAVPGGYRISGRKCFISNGSAARWITLFAARRGAGVESWSCFLLEKSMAGLTVGRRERKLGQRAADASELVLEGVFVPQDRLVGREGCGWAINRNVLNYSRPVVGAVALGIARGAFEHATQFCSVTRLGNSRLIDYQDVQLTLSDMLLKLSAMRAMVWHASGYRLPFQAAGAMAKVFCSDTAWHICTTAMALLGDHGYLHANSVEKAARDARLTQIYEGTNDINRLAIFESQLGAEFPAAP